MVPLEEELGKNEQENADYLFKKVAYKDDLMNKESVKGVGFAKPLFEFHGACPGCGETTVYHAYYKALWRAYDRSKRDWL